VIQKIKSFTSKASASRMFVPVVSGLIVATVVAITAYILNIEYAVMFSAMSSFSASTLSSIAIWFTQDITLQLWLLLLIGLVLLIAIPLGMFIYQSRSEQENDQPQLDYNKDTILGIDWVWDWRYSNDKWVFNKPDPICPECGNTLEYTSNPLQHFPTDDIIFCSHLECSWEFDNPTHYNTPKSKQITCPFHIDKCVQKEIVRKLSTEEYLTVI
jgi:hypothetical protein